MLDLVSGILKALLNCRTKDWIETTNPAEQSGQKQVKRDDIRAEGFNLYVGRNLCVRS
jgi:hypothetical protein